MVRTRQHHPIRKHYPTKIMIVDDGDVDREMIRLGLELQREITSLWVKRKMDSDQSVGEATGT